MISKKEDVLKEESSWTIKILKKSGQPLANLLIPRFGINLGCHEMMKCDASKEGDRIKCSKKNLVYEAECKRCKERESCSSLKTIQTTDHGIEEVRDINRREISIKAYKSYVEETARTLRQRYQEHIKKLNTWQ